MQASQGKVGRRKIILHDLRVGIVNAAATIFRQMVACRERWLWRYKGEDNAVRPEGPAS
jgi:hypothetical protein